MVIRVPAAVYAAANRYAGTGSGQGRRQMEALLEAVRPSLKANEEILAWRRDKNGLFAETRVIPDQPGIPDKIKRKPNR